MLKRSFFYILFALSLVGVLGFTFVSERSPVVVCEQQAFISTKSVDYLHPEKIVVQPWRGQHQVYAIFMIPKAYQNQYLFKLTLPNNETYCGGLHHIYHPANDGITPKPEYYFMKGYLNTRIALEVIFQGKFNELNQPMNWKLGYFKKWKK